jgi:serine/threonine protein kinase
MMVILDYPLKLYPPPCPLAPLRSCTMSFRVDVQDSEEWRRIEEIFLAAADKDGPSRARYLDEACAGDATVRTEVESLLAAEAEGRTEITSLIRGSLVSLVSGPGEESGGYRASQVFSPDRGAVKGQVIGEWLLAEEIGRGGMGTVYRAKRGNGEFSIDAAVKILSRGVNSQVLLDRFRRERQILARLEHPNIARLLDGGKTAAGQPYLVMEYVAGMPLTRYCDERQLSVRERVALFRRVCDAVSCAHRNLVIHRDLKPDNILVTGDGVPKLLDFGIAKLLEPGTGDSGDLTMTAERVGTPAWCSPEQISGDHIGVATDVYSLGVVLFRLLTGYRPYQADSVTWENATAVICQRAPLRASEAVTSKPGSEAEAQAVARQRGTVPEVLRRQLSGDPDNILAYALRKEPDRRYRSVDQFSEELQRYLEGRPVMAAGDTVLYLAGKFIRRHKAAVGAAAILTFLLCISTVVAVWQARRLSVRLTEDRKLATSLLFDLHDNISRLPGSLPAREALLRKSLDYLNGLERDAGEDRETRRSLALAGERFANLLGTLGRSADAVSTWQTARLTREALAEQDPSDVTAQYNLARNYLGGALIVSRARRVEEMQGLNSRALRIAETLAAGMPGKREYQVLLAESWASVANALNIAGKPDEATAALRKAVPIREKLAADRADIKAQHELATVRYYLGILQTRANRFTPAMKDLDEALRLQTSLPPTPGEEALLRYEIASTHHFEGIVLGELGKYDEALGHFREAIALRERALQEDEHDARTRSMLAGNYSERSWVLLNKGERQQALASMQHAIGLLQPLLALDTKDVPGRVSMATFQSRLATILAANHREQEAAEAWRHAVRFYDDLRRGGYLTAPDVIQDSEKAHAEAAKFAAKGQP